MNKLDENPTALTIVPASFPDFRPVSRLIILVPESLVDPAGAAEKYGSGKDFGHDVQLIGLCKDVMSEPSLRRQLIFLSVMVNDGLVSVESKVEFGNDWLKVVQTNRHEGDVIVCFDGQYTGLMHKPVSQLIKSNLKLDVYVLEGGVQTRSASPGWLSSVIAWTGSLSILVIFFWLQVQIIKVPEVWVQNTLMYLSIPIEVGLIWGWNTLFP
ncbi:hypothetical protein [Candidatus Villigracilis affinis]|uniref:hypothetical protein n=1 Tax=Candidatus Villigracilis affinis TaxID=3140682 RepID=UPI002A225D7D|nr:hypothetical protein [Anaerolineales bacterium]